MYDDSGKTSVLLAGPPKRPAMALQIIIIGFPPPLVKVRPGQRLAAPTSQKYVFPLIDDPSLLTYTAAPCHHDRQDALELRSLIGMRAGGVIFRPPAKKISRTLRRSYRGQARQSAQRRPVAAVHRGARLHKLARRHIFSPVLPLNCIDKPDSPGSKKSQENPLEMPMQGNVS